MVADELKVGSGGDSDTAHSAAINSADNVGQTFENGDGVDMEAALDAEEEFNAEIGDGHKVLSKSSVDLCFADVKGKMHGSRAGAQGRGSCRAVLGRSPPRTVGYCKRGNIRGTLIFADFAVFQQARIQKPAKIFAIFCMHILDT